MRKLSIIFGLLCSALLASCKSEPADDPVGPQTVRANTPAKDVLAEPLAASTAAPTPMPAPFPAPADSPPPMQVSSVHFVMMLVPVGTVSGSNNFWKRIDESPHVVDVATYDLLFKNGIRVGMGSVAEWPYFKNLLDPQGVEIEANAEILVPPGTQQPLTINASKDLPNESIFRVDRNGQLIGRSFDDCQNQFAASFLLEPRIAHTLRIELCPAVRATRKRYTYTVMNREIETKFENVEKQFDLNLRADVPPGAFLVIAPSSEVCNSLGIGYHFLTEDGNASRSERVMIFSSAGISSPGSKRPSATQPVPLTR